MWANGGRLMMDDQEDEAPLTEEEALNSRLLGMLKFEVEWTVAEVREAWKSGTIREFVLRWIQPKGRA